MGWLGKVFGKTAGVREHDRFVEDSVEALEPSAPPLIPRRHAGKPVSNVLMLVDLSYSVGQEALDHVSERGLRCIVDTLRRQTQSNEIIYNFCLLGFSAFTREIIAFTPAHELAARNEWPQLSCESVTCMEDALWEAFARIDAEKAAQDAARTPRAGSLVLVVTDGRPTDDQGGAKPLSALLVEEIRRRNESRETTTFVVGMGDVDDETLRQVGPALAEQVPGAGSFKVARAVRYTADDYQSSQCWEAVCSLVGRASSSSTGTPFVASSDEEAARLPDCADVLMLDPSKFRVVR